MRKNILTNVFFVLAVSVSSVALLKNAVAQTFDGGMLGEVVVTGKAPTYKANFAGSATDVGGGLVDGPTDENDLANRSMTVTTTTNKNGEVKTETEERALLGGNSGGSDAAIGTPSADEKKAAADADEAAKKSEDAKKEEEKKKEDEEKYDGLYNGRHIIPDIMAMHCKIKGEDVAKNPKLFIDCIKQYVSEMNNPNASAKAEAEKEYEILRYKFLTDAGATAITKSQVVENHEETMNKHNEAHSEMKTESDDNKSITASLSFVTNMMNDIRELQVEQLKYMVVNGIGDLDPSVIMDEEEPEEEKKEEANTSGGAGDPEFNSTNVKVETK